MNHLSEEEMVEAYYGSEFPHLAECAECRALFEQQREALDGLKAYPVPERSPGYGGEVWSRLLPQLPKRRQHRAWWFMVPAFAATLVLAFLIGRSSSKMQPAATAIPEQARERVLLLSLSEHLERSQIVLAQVANTGDLAEERDRARELIGANRLLRQTAERLGDRQDATVLENLEHVLLDVANAPDSPSNADTARVQQSIAQNELLFKVRIASTDARNRGLKL